MRPLGDVPIASMRLGAGVGFGVTVELAPDVRLHATSRGVRASVEPPAADPHVGTDRSGLDTDGRPVSYETSVDGVGAQLGSPLGSARSTLAQLHMEARTTDRAKSIQRVVQAEHALTTRHLVDFPVNQQAFAPATQPFDVDRLEQSFRRQAMTDVGWFNRARRQAAGVEARTAAVAVADAQYAMAVEEAERLRSAYHAHLNALSAHHRDTVVEAVDDALAEHAPESTCVEAGTDPDSGRYVSCVVILGHPDLVPSRRVATNLTGRPALKKRSRADINDLYVASMGSAVLATVRQALAVAPAADEVRIAVVRNAPATAAAPGGGISVIFAGVFPRHEMETIHWPTIDPASELLRARGAELVRKGAARTVVPLDLDAHRRMAAVLHAFSAPEDEDGAWGD